MNPPGSHFVALHLLCGAQTPPRNAWLARPTHPFYAKGDSACVSYPFLGLV